MSLLNRNRPNSKKLGAPLNRTPSVSSSSVSDRCQAASSPPSSSKESRIKMNEIICCFLGDDRVVMPCCTSVAPTSGTDCISSSVNVTIVQKHCRPRSVHQLVADAGDDESPSVRWDNNGFNPSRRANVYSPNDRSRARLMNSNT